MKKKWIRDALLFGIQTKMWKIMRLNAFFLLLCFSHAWALSGYSQETKLTLKMSDSKIIEVLDEIEEQSEFYFLFNQKLVDVERKVDIDVQEKSIDFILQNLFAGTNVNHMVIDRQIVLTTFNEKLLPQQQPAVSGTVTDSFGQPLPGVTVVVKGTTQGTVTNADGEYSLTSIPEDATLVFSFVGMRTQEVEVGSQTKIDIRMAVDAIGIEEVVAIGYGTVKKSDLTGSVGSMKAEELLKQPVARLDQALQGRISGVQVTTINGAPGTGSTVRIRGGNSINAGNEPLYVIDGLIGAGDLNAINPNDILSIEVLKDASSTAIYGSRGSNGVILITTKRGDDSVGFGISYDSYYGVQSVLRTIDLLNGFEYADFRNEYGSLIGTSTPFPDVKSVSNTDWQEMLFRKAPITDHNLNFYNKTENSNYYVSLNYFDQKGIQLGSGFKRYQIRMNFDQDIYDLLKIGASVNAAYSERENPRTTAFVNHILPTSPVYNEDGTYFSVNPINGATYNNPIALNELVSNESNRIRILGNIYSQIIILDGLDFKSTFGWDFEKLKTNVYGSGSLPTRYEANSGGYATINTSSPITIQNENTLNYLKRKGEHELNILGGWTIQEYFYESLNVNASGFTNDVSTYNAIQTGDPSLLSASSGETRWSLLSALYRLNYNYKGKYLLTVSGRHDGSSRLAKGNQWEFFPSAAIAWKLSEEKFVKEIGFISNLKLRISYGKTGSQSIAPYATHARLSSGYTYLGNQQVVTFSPAISANSSLKWEVTNQTDIGANLGLFNNRLNLEVDYYHKKTNDLLLERELSGQTGFSSRLENVGSLQNNGIEFNIDGIIISNNNFSWHSNLTYALNKNEVLELSGDKEYLMNGTGSRIIIGEPIGTFTGAKFIGLWQDTDENIGTHIPGSPKFEDIDGNGIINENDVQILGKGTPDFYGGWNNIFKYKHLTVSCFFDFSYGNDIYDLNGREFNTGHASNVYGKYRDRWTTSNTNSNIPRAGSMQQDYWENVAKIGTNLDIYDGSYFRLKTLNIQYEIPTNKKIFKNIVFYTSATNLFTLTKYEGFSPDVNSEGTNSTRRGFDNYNLPQARVFLLGIKTNF